VNAPGRHHRKYSLAGLFFDSELSIHCIHSMYSGIYISQTDARPMYLQIMEQIRARIAAGEWAAGKELPSIRALAASLNVSVITIKRAYLDLESEGVIVTRHGKGSFVADVNGLAGELQDQKLDEHLADAVTIARQIGLSEEELAARLRRVLKEKK
jgi:GntR family transcriptional regulator